MGNNVIGVWLRLDIPENLQVDNELSYHGSHRYSPLPKPETGRYHLVRFIRSNLKLNIFGEIFSVAPELQYEYVVATVDVKEQKLKLSLGHTQVDEFKYKLR